MKINKITKLYSPTISQEGKEDVIQTHLDELNADGWSLCFVEDMNGWYRFFWEKEVVNG